MGSDLQLDDILLGSLSSKIGAWLETRTVIVSVAEVDDGANATNGHTHFAARTDGNDFIGLKASDRVALGTMKERLIWELCEILELPNACRVGKLHIDEIQNLRGKDVNGIEWLPASAAFDKLIATNPQIVENIRKRPTAFLDQLGECIVVGLIFGVRDRHSGNWVWRDAFDQLAMIDTEASFDTTFVQATRIDVAEYRVFIDAVLTANGRKGLQDRTTTGSLAFIRGIRAMYRKYVARLPKLETRIKASGISFAPPTLPDEGVFVDLILKDLA